MGNEYVPPVDKHFYIFFLTCFDWYEDCVIDSGLHHLVSQKRGNEYFGNPWGRACALKKSIQAGVMAFVLNFSEGGGYHS